MDTNNIYPLHYTDIATSWNRIKLLFQLYWPVLKPTFINFALFPFVACFLIASIKTGPSVALLDTLLNIAVVANVCVCPILLAKRDYRDVCSQLPVTVSEKLGFLLLTFVIAFPVVIYGSMYLGQFVGYMVFGIKIPVEFLCLPTRITVLGESIWSVNGLAMHITTNLLMIASIIVVSLYYIVKTKKNRTLAGIMSFAIMYSLIIFLLVIWSVLFNKILSFPSSVEASVTLSNYAAHATLIVVWIIGLVYLLKLYKSLKNSGF